MECRMIVFLKHVHQKCPFSTVVDILVKTKKKVLEEKVWHAIEKYHEHATRHTDFVNFSC